MNIKWYTAGNTALGVRDTPRFPTISLFFSLAPWQVPFNKDIQQTSISRSRACESLEVGVHNDQLEEGDLSGYKCFLFLLTIDSNAE
jgi:hypothetical protein